MPIHNIAVTGLFQQGKSLTVNCLLGAHASEIGIGIATTRKVGRWRLNHDVDISDTPGFDSTGENAASDTAEAEAAVSNADFIVFVVPNQMVDQTTHGLLLDILHTSFTKKPLALLMNCQARSNDPSLQDPLSEKNQKTAETIGSQLRDLRVLSIDGESPVFTYNPAWYWFGLVAQNKRLVENLGDNQKEILRSINQTVSSYREYYEEREILAAEFMANSRLGEFKRFLEEQRFIPRQPTKIVAEPIQTGPPGWGKKK